MMCIYRYDYIIYHTDIHTVSFVVGHPCPFSPFLSSFKPSRDT